VSAPASVPTGVEVDAVVEQAGGVVRLADVSPFTKPL
jgi:hypothetical protein